MWALLMRRFRLWLLLAIGAPVVGWLLAKFGDALESRSGPTSLTGALHRGGDWLQRHARGPVARRRRRRTDPGADKQ